MKVIVRAILLFSITLTLISCNGKNSGIQNAPTEEIQQMIDGKQTGFVIITNETDTPFLDEVQRMLLEKKESAMQFNVFRNDGKNGNPDGLSKNPFRFEMQHVNAIYYLKDGKVYGEYGLETHAGLRQQEELRYFIDSMTRGTANE